MTLHRALAWTFGAFLGAAVWLDYQRGDGAVIVVTLCAATAVVGYRLAEEFYRGGWSS